MRAKLVKESVADVLAPKSKEEIMKLMNDQFEKINNITYKEAQQITKKLIDLGVDARLDKLDPRIHHVSNTPIKLVPWRIFEHSSHVASAPTEEYARQLFIALKNFSVRTRYLRLEEPDNSSLSGEYMSIKEAKEWINKLRIGVKTTMMGAPPINISDKMDQPDYDEWYETKGRDIMKKRREAGDTTWG